MSFAPLETAARLPEGIPFPDGTMVELALLVPAGQAAALEAVARHLGLTVGQLARRLIRDFLNHWGNQRGGRHGQRKAAHEPGDA